MTRVSSPGPAVPCPPAWRDNAGVREPSPFAIGSVLAAVLAAGCASPAASPAPSTAPPSAGATTTTAGPVEAHVAPCPVPAADYAGTPYAPHAAPATMRLPAAVPLLPADAQTLINQAAASNVLNP